MKITFILPSMRIGGGTRVVAIMSGRLSERGHDVTVIFSESPKPGLKDHFRSLLKNKHFAKGKTTDTTYFKDSSVRLINTGKTDAITADMVPEGDVVVATWWRTAEWLHLYPESKGAKVYFCQHYENFAYTPSERVDQTWRLPMHKIAVSQWLVDIAARKFNDHDVSLVPNSVDLNQFNSPPRHKQPVPTVGVMYSRSPFKRVGFALQAVRLAQKGLPDLRFVAFGNTPEDPAYPLPEEAVYQVNPPQEKLREFYGQCDAWLFSSSEEGFGLPILEAMACRTPVIATPAGAAPELVAKGGGVLVAQDDPTDMAKAILRFAGMPDEEWRLLSEKAHATACDYTWDHATALFEKALEKAIERRNRGEIL